MRRWVKTLLILAAVLILAVGVSTVVSNTVLSVVEYAVELDSVTEPVHLVVISDLHERSYGKNNERLISVIRRQEPDSVFLVGDMVGADADAAEVENLLALIRNLTECAPVFFSPGNHEMQFMETDGGLLEQVAGAGATVLNDSYVDVTIAGQPLRIGGTMGHGFPFGRTEEEFSSSPEYIFLKDFENTENPTICLAHMPDTFIFNGAYTLWDVDLAISGHTHGGLIRIPWLGGLYAPMQEWFPTYDRGLFRLGEDMQIVITSGLAGYGFLPRVNNLPEVVVVDLIPAEE